MSLMLDGCLRSWPFTPWLLIALLSAAGVYLRGWLAFYRRDSQRWHGGQLAAFLGGLAAIYLALASPLEPFAALLLQVHMIQHVLLMMVGPPLLWLGTPLFPMLRGLPRPIRIYGAVPLLSSPLLRRFTTRMTHPLVALPIFVATTWLWHTPAVYDAALRSGGWHYLQHLCFLGTALLFWYPVIRPYHSRPLWSLWLLLPYLLLADLSNTVLSALLTFSPHVLYAYYEETPRLGGLSVLDDQSAAGVIMWVPGSLVSSYRSSLSASVSCLSRKSERQGDKETRRQGGKELMRRIPLTVLAPSGPLFSLSPCLPVSLSPCLPVSPSPFDLLRVPLLGRFLKWRHARLCLQVPLLVLAALVIYDGFHGPQVGAMNLAGVLPWIHWRGLVILGLLVAGNVFCMGCPFLLPRTIARRWLPGGWTWPRRLRSKWLAVLLLACFLWAYEALTLWDRPAWTACLALGYFGAAFVTDSLFRGASFCKYVCPIGQFNFVQSLTSPLEVKVRDPAVCASCWTKDCIRGRDGIPGCELRLFLPRKVGNMDCTACLDCVHACPHDNVGLSARWASAELWDGHPRSGIGRLGRRPDIAAMILVLVFGAFANAAGMVGAVVEWQQQLAELVGVRSTFLTTTLYYLLALAVLPLLVVGGAAELSRRWGRVPGSTLVVATRFAYALVPLGFGMWLAHYSFHFLTSFDTVFPVGQRFAAEHGITFFGDPQWVYGCCRPVTSWLLPVEILSLDFGLLSSLYTGYRLAPTLKALAPWALLMGLLFTAGLWILFQPMQMRGTL